MGLGGEREFWAFSLTVNLGDLISEGLSQTGWRVCLPSKQETLSLRDASSSWLPPQQVIKPPQTQVFSSVGHRENGPCKLPRISRHKTARLRDDPLNMGTNISVTLLVRALLLTHWPQTSPFSLGLNLLICEMNSLSWMLFKGPSGSSFLAFMLESLKSCWSRTRPSSCLHTPVTALAPMLSLSFSSSRLSLLPTD